MMRSHSGAFRARSRRLVSWPLLLASVMAVVPLLAAAPLLSAGAGVNRRDAVIHVAAITAPVVRSTLLLRGIGLDRAELESRDDRRAPPRVDAALASARIVANTDPCIRLDPIVRDVTRPPASSAMCGYDATAPPRFLL